MVGKTWKTHTLHIIRLYERLRQKKATSNEMASTLGLYVKRWQRWAVAGLRVITIEGLSRNTCFAFTEPDQPNQGRSE